MLSALLIVFCLFSGYNCAKSDGGVIPLPQKIVYHKEYFALSPKNFRFNSSGYTCSILDEALYRYWNIIAGSYSSSRLYGRHESNEYRHYNDVNYLGYLNIVHVHVDKPCHDNDLPYLFMNENYTITLNQSKAAIESSSVWGVLRGLETFSQLIHLASDRVTLIVNSSSVEDFPKFPHRGLLLDTSRHFIPLNYILKNLDAMSFNKLNVFHWHIVDDQSFPYQSINFPELSQLGAYHPVAAVYTQAQIKQVIEYARLRGIRVMIEFDTPGHTLSWGKGIGNILTECINLSEKFGPMDPSSDKVYKFLEIFFQEIASVFPDKYVHLGGDEVPFDCWRSNKNISNFMRKLNITGDYSALESYFINKVINIVDKQKLHSIVWEEVFTNGVKIPDTTIVHVWKDEFQQTLKKVTSAGKPTLLSSCWYLDHLGGTKDWLKYYKCDPYDFSGNYAQKKLVLGGEACMWSEMVNEFNVMTRIWPRACAAAEKLWSTVTTMNKPIVNPTQIEDMTLRIEEHTCRLISRGIDTEPPTGPGYCL